MSHTPGPLTILRSQSTKWDEAGDYAIIDTEGKIVGEAFKTVDHLDKAAPRPAEANARLWAAAPDLLAALEGCVLRLEMEDMPVVTNTLSAAKAAIAKATGVVT